MSDPRQAGTAAVTGAGGYIGGIVSTALAADGFDVIRLVRRPEAGSSDRLYDLRRDLDASLLEGVDTLIHCAYDFSVTSEADIWAVNVVGTRRLLEAAAASGVRRTIVVSSMSAYPGTDQLYGRAKLDTERTALDLGMVVVQARTRLRPGLGRNDRFAQEDGKPATGSDRWREVLSIHRARGGSRRRIRRAGTCF